MDKNVFEGKKMRNQISTQEIEVGIRKLIDKLDERLAEKGRGTFSSRHEILGILTEEYLETCEAVHNKRDGEISDELLDVAVAAVFGMICIDSKKTDW